MSEKVLNYYQSKKEELRAYKAEWHRKQRQRVVEALGGKCVRCNFSDIRALQVDHVHGNGCKARRAMPRGSYFGIVLRELKELSGKYQLLCANCNWIKRAENCEN